MYAPSYIMIMYDGAYMCSLNRWEITVHACAIMTLSNRNIFRVTDHLCGEFTGRRWQRPVTHSYDVVFYLRLNKWFSKCWRGCRHAHYDVTVMRVRVYLKVVISAYHKDSSSFSKTHKQSVNWFGWSCGVPNRYYVILAFVYTQW